ncbi:hypothetical protein BDV19DRAFT_365518 [Aspergillus venezuelensis]
MGSLLRSNFLSSFPTELVVLIASFLDYQSEVNALSRVSHYYYDILNPVLYKNIARDDKNDIFKRAVEAGVDAVALEAVTLKTFRARIKPTIESITTAISHGHERIVALMCEELKLH